MNYTHVIIAACLIFASGGATGYFIGQKQMQPELVAPKETKFSPEGRAPWMGRDPLRDFVKFLERKLNITEQQQNDINQVIKDSNESMKKIWDDVRPKASAEMAATNEKIKTVLSPDQAEKFEELMDEFRRERFKRHISRGGGPRHGDPDNQDDQDNQEKRRSWNPHNKERNWDRDKERSREPREHPRGSNENDEQVQDHGRERERPKPSLERNHSNDSQEQAAKRIENKPPQPPAPKAAGPN